MKRKFSLLINIATLVLCVSAIAIGVYSAKTASLNVSGSIGFTAHNCKVQVDSSLSGFAETQDGGIVATARTSTKIVEGTATLDLGTFYFTDLTATGDTNDITLLLKFTNKSDFAVDIAIAVKDLSGSNITVTANKQSLTLAEQTADSGTSAEVKVTLKCTPTTKIDSTKFEILSVKMEKYKEPFAVQYGAINGLTGARTYVTMGKYNNQDLKWYIFAKNNADNSGMEAVSARVENNGVLSSGTYWFISEYVLDYDVANKIYGIPFGSQIYKDSDIQSYLNNVDKGATAENSFAKKYNLSANNNATYNYLLKNGGRELPTETGVPGVEDTDYTLPGQYFWLLSVTELTYLAGEQVSVYGTYSKLIAKDATSSHNSAEWWTRSPFDYYYAFLITNKGKVDSDLSSIYGVRPAFQITIS